jgi:hypothetical protein
VKGSWLACAAASLLLLGCVRHALGPEAADSAAPFDAAAQLAGQL